MAEFSERSLKRLCGVHPDLQTVMNYVVKDFDITVISGIRTEEEQKALYAKGRTKPGNIVTYMDGVERRSKHQTGNAIDVAPWPLDWKSIDRFKEMGWYIKGVARMLKEYGAIDSDIKWGGDWRKFSDYPHFEL